jgi:hypothetical protein
MHKKLMIEKIAGRPYPRDGTPQITNEQLQIHRPLHLIRGMATLSEYAQVDAHVSLLITALASADPAPIAAIYGELRQGQMQAKALRAVAKVVLDTEDQALLEQVMGMVKVASDARDMLAHRVWMYDQQYPDDAVLVNPALFWLTDHKVKVGGGPGPTTTAHALEIQEMMRRECLLWSLDELERARVASVHSVVGLQAFRLMHLSAVQSATRAAERQTVMNVLALAFKRA